MMAVMRVMWRMKKTKKPSVPRARLVVCVSASRPPASPPYPPPPAVTTSSPPPPTPPPWPGLGAESRGRNTVWRSFTWCDSTAQDCACIPTFVNILIIYAQTESVSSPSPIQHQRLYQILYERKYGIFL